MIVGFFDLQVVTGPLLRPSGHRVPPVETGFQVTRRRLGVEPGPESYRTQVISQWFGHEGTRDHKGLVLGRPVKDSSGKETRREDRGR